MNFIDLFAGAGGLSEGFKKAGFNPIAHVEMDKAACFTLKTRLAYYYLKESNQLEIYNSYIKGEISRKKFYGILPDCLLKSVINKAVGGDNNAVIFDDIDQIKGEKEIDMIVGGPPCQAYSSIGRAALKHKPSDVRKFLYLDYGKFLEKYKPKIFVFENVPGLKTCDEGKYYKNLKFYFKELGYEIEDKLLNALDFGVIQRRERLIIIGWKEGLNFQYPEFESIKNSWTSEDIFSDLPVLQPGGGTRVCKYALPENEYLKLTGIRNCVEFVSLHITRPHNEKDLNIYKLAINKMEEGIRLKNDQIPEEQRTQKNTKDFLDRFKVVGKIPHTMIAHISNDGHHFIHPSLTQTRSLSVREAARIQSFPDNYYFEGVKENQNRTAAFRQIGNAVPPLMAEKIAFKIKQQLND